MASKYGDLGFQDRLLVSGSTVEATFVFCFLEKGGLSDLPAIYFSIAKSFSSETCSAGRSGIVERPELNDGETYQQLTTRWLCAAYDALRGLSAEMKTTFSFSESYPIDVAPGVGTVPPLNPPVQLMGFPTALATWRDLPIGAISWVGSDGHVITWSNGSATSCGLILSDNSDALPFVGQQYVAVQYRIRDWTNAARLLEAGASREVPFVEVSRIPTVLLSTSAWIEAVTFYGDLTQSEIDLVKSNPV